MERCLYDFASRPSSFVESAEGKELQAQLWVQTMKKLEGIAPGISKSV